MTGIQDIQHYADQIMAMIREDQGSGQVPRDVSSWDELDDSVDTDDYLRQAHLPSGTPEAAELRNAVSGEVGQRLIAAQGGPWHVTWTRPGEAALDVGRAVGYATRAQAEAVGREYLSEHGGAFHVHGA
jgi:hypothetical protein